MWLSYALVRLLTEKETVVYHFYNETYLFLGNSVYRRILGRVTHFPPTKHRTLCLIDPDGGRSEEDLRFMTFTKATFAVMASSPNPKLYDHFMKQRAPVPMEFMPLWTRDELKKG
jgi:hypothetical protein